MPNTIQIKIDARGVATLSLMRAHKHNALSAQMIAELHAAATDLGNDAAVRVVVLAAEGPSFCAGADLGWMQAQMNADTESRATQARALAHMLGALNTLPKPLIGRIQGNAYGGGVGLACVCDVAIAADDAKFGLTETRLGLIPATVAPYVIARLGEGRARRVFMSARLFGADEAVSLGLVARAVPARALDDAIEAEVLPYLACAPDAVAAAKALARAFGPVIDDAVINKSIEALLARWQSDQARQGISAFLAKKPPPWAAKS